MQVLTAPGVMIHEIDKSQYSPAMENTCCFIMGFANRGEAYTPMEFTSRTAWINYYGEPDTEAERYFYAAACEVLNQNGRLYCARLPYDNVSFEKVVAFKYKLDTANNKGYSIASGDYSCFSDILTEDDTLDNVVGITPTEAPTLYELSTIDEYRTDELKVPNNTFLIADVAYNSYNRIQEDKNRKDYKRELIGIMPVVTTAANALYTQGFLNIDNRKAYNYETIGAIRTLDAAAQLGNDYPTKQTLLTSDCAVVLNSRDHYTFTTTDTCLCTYQMVINDTNVGLSSKTEIKQYIKEAIIGEHDYAISTDTGDLADITLISDYVADWNGQYQSESNSDNTILTVTFSAKTKYDLPIDDDRYGWHNPDGDDDLPDTVSFEANSYFPTITTFTDDNGDLRIERTNLKKIGLVVYKMYMDPSEGNKISFEPVEAYAGSLGKDDKDPDTGVTTFLDTIVNSQSEYVNFFSNCWNTKAGKKYYDEELDLYVVQPPKKQPGQLIDVNVDNIRKLRDEIVEIVKGASGDYAALVSTLTDENLTLTGLIEACSQVGADLLLQTNSASKTIDDILIELHNEYANKIASAGTLNTDDDLTTASLGFYWSMVKEDISIDKSIYDGINKSFEKVSDINERNIDIVCDAGIANIASYLKAIYGNKGEYDLNIVDDVGNSLLGMWKCKSNNSAIKTWKAVEQKYDNFCKNVRKDCMFIADGPRPLVLQGQKKIVRPTKPANTIDANILPYLKYITGLNTSYGAGYMDWFEQADDYSGDFFWCPPSIKAMGVYLNTDANYQYWDAPAGLNRGVIAATDVAFSPTMSQAGAIYEKNWNYAINYPQDGIVLEGQKTFQVKASAFDRVNVRRLFCRLERQAYKVSRYFVYEGNTAYTRQRLVDALDPYFKEAKAGNGIYDYKIKCDENNNTPETIDRNELHCAIGIKPVKTAEFIYIDFVALRTGGSWEEAGF